MERFSKRTKKEAQDWVRIAKKERRYPNSILTIKKYTNSDMLKRGWKWYVEVKRK